jgi:hypothetical protein
MTGRSTSLRRSGRLAGVLALVLAAPLIQGSASRLSSLDERLLAAHNRERSAAGIAPLEWDDTLSAEAEEWADHLAALGDIEHSPDDPDELDPQGENLWLGTRGAYSPEEMVDLWIEEKKHYRPGIFPAVSRTGDLDDVGHYTQLMWAETGRVGCAVSDSDDYEILVCRYRQAGNVIGERAF